MDKGYSLLSVLVVHSLCSCQTETPSLTATSSDGANPQAYEIEKRELSKGDKLDVKLAAGGGFAMSLLEKK